MNSNKRIGLIWANLNSTNLGVSALAYSAIVIFQEIARRKNLKFEYILWGGGEDKNREISINSETVSIHERKFFCGGDMMRYLKNLIRRPWTFLNYKSIFELKKCDILADTGEGDSYSDIYGIERFRNFNYIKTVFHSSKKPYILLPQTIGPFESEEAKRKAHISLEKAAVVIARDNQSYSFCNEISPKSNLLRSIDMAFFLPYETLKLPKSNKVRIGVNISGLLWDGGYTKNNQFGLKSNYKKSILRLLEYLNTQPYIEVHLIGHVLGNDNSIDDDWHALTEISKKYPTFVLAPKFTSPIEAKSYISSLDFFTGARMHACIAAISSGVPVLPMAYSRKFNGLFLETLCYPHLIDLKTMDETDIVSIFADCYNSRKSIREQITEIQEKIINVEKSRMINLISDFIK